MPTRRVAQGPPPGDAQRAWSQTTRPEDTRRAGPPPPPPGRSAGPAAGYAPPQQPQPIPPGGPRGPGYEYPRGANQPRSPQPGYQGGGSRRGGPPPAPPTPGGSRFRRRPGRKRFPIFRTLLVLILVLVLVAVGLFFYYDSKLHRVDALSSYAGRIGDTPGTNWLVVGTDSRAGLTEAQKEQLATGDSDGARTDTIMLMHIPRSGKAMIVSIPRDLYVPIPGQGQDKINAAFNNGGPNLLVQTIETNTKVHIDHYAEIGFAGFDKLVNAVGGVDMCLTQPIDDPAAGINLKPGCQKLNGKEALGFVRSRHTFANQDLGRVVNQRKFLSALMSKATSWSTLLNPFRIIPFTNGAVGTLTVDKHDHIWNLLGLAWALRSNPVTTTAPTAGPEETDAGSSLAWGDNTTEFFNLIAHDQKIPAGMIENTGGAVS
nr:LCP family protein [Jongsikchunia kroppenstedtii]